MIKISIFYPNTGKFDMDYYLNTHMTRSIQLLSEGKGYHGVSVEKGLCGATADSAATYIAMCHFLFDTLEDFMAAFMQHAEELKGDKKNYTDILNTIQVSEVVISR